MDKSQLGIPKGIRLVHVGDREADVYEFFDHATMSHQDFLVRVVQNRNTTEACKLFDKVRNEPPAGEIVVDIPRDTRRNVPQRTATLAIKYCKANVHAPANTPKEFRKNASVTLWILLVQEIDPPQGMEPIEWYLATSMDITNVDEAMERVTWYMHRWKIERFHYILKNGCEIEELQNKKAERIQKLILMYSIISIRILSMTYKARQNPETPCTEFLEEQEWKVLYCIANRTSTIPPIAPTIKEAVSYLAKLGGFLGRKGDGEPGVKVIWKGLTELNIVLKHYNYLSP
ncbi:IS4 family transposase [Fodinisporobacter ferrooxydans]|uniref:IS4 family transposase n=1 Tax=Fodinisporobacter ferrooxydans TaxID=2901836 RepID=A0ABY4CEF2_9BACL|nr:IS4 family transposase [Alicyclobacillaceae bacterium MYW30-H2]